MSLDVGSVAPDFTLKSQHGEDITLSSFRGDKNVVLVFIPFAFSGICTGELGEIRDNPDLFDAAGAQVLVISCDHFFANRAFEDRAGIRDLQRGRRGAQPRHVRHRSRGDGEVDGAQGNR
jgi:peroxiredoxin